MRINKSDDLEGLNRVDDKEDRSATSTIFQDDYDLTTGSPQRFLGQEGASLSVERSVYTVHAGVGADRASAADILWCAGAVRNRLERNLLLSV